MKTIRDFLTPLRLTITCKDRATTVNVEVVFDGPARFRLVNRTPTKDGIYFVDIEQNQWFTRDDIIDHPAFEEYIRLSYLELEQSNGSV